MLNPAVVDFPNPKAHRADFWRHLVNDEALQDCDDLEKLVAFHRGHGKIATVTAVRPPGRFGELSLAQETVVEFNEKPQAAGGLINGGFFVFDARRIWNYVKAETGCVLETEPMRALVRDKQLAAFEHTGFWQPMDTLREYTMLNDLWTSERAPWKVWA